METAGLVSIVEAIATSSNAAIFVAVWIAWKAGKTATEAVEAIKEIRNAVAKGAPVVERLAVQVDDIDQATRSIESRGAAMDMKLAALVARKQ